MSNSLTERRAERLLAESDSLKVPVAVEKVARHLGLIVQARPLGDASGVLVVESGRGMIGYNANHSQVRQRFTIAHEVGHFVLHAAGQQQRLFVTSRSSGATKLHLRATIARRLRPTSSPRRC